MGLGAARGGTPAQGTDAYKRAWHAHILTLAFTCTHTALVFYTAHIHADDYHDVLEGAIFACTPHEEGAEPYVANGTTVRSSFTFRLTLTETFNKSSPNLVQGRAHLLQVSGSGAYLFPA